MKRSQPIFCIAKRILIVIVFLSSFGTYAQKVKSEDVPQAVKTTFANEFPNAKIKEWQLKVDQYWALYKDDGTTQTTIFDVAGTVIETRTPISKQELPGFVMEYTATEYPGFEVATCNLIQKPKTKDSYLVELKKAGVGTGGNSELSFSSDGKLLSRKDPEGFVVAKKEETTHQNAPKVEKNSPNKGTNKNKQTEKVAKNPNEKAETPISKANKKNQYPENIISENSVPPIVKKNFIKKFPKADQVKWFNKQGDTIYTIKCIFREQDNEIQYTASGKWISQKIQLDEKSVFPAVQKYLDKTYRKYEFVSCEKRVTFDKNAGGFDVKIYELKNKKKKLETTILFDKMGKLVKTIDPETSYEEVTEKETSADRKFDQEYNNTATNVDNEGQSGTKVNQKELPSDITSYISANYPGMKIKSSFLRDIDDLGMCYEVTVAREGINQESTLLIFDKMGKFIKNDSGQEISETVKTTQKTEKVAFTPPDTILNSFKVKHPKVSKCTWEAGEENDFIASYTDGTGAHKSHFSADGIWVKISTVMNPENVSPNIKTYVEKNHKGYKIISARNVKKADKKTYYEVDIQHKKTADTQSLEFNQAGKPTSAGDKE